MDVENLVGKLGWRAEDGSDGAGNRLRRGCMELSTAIPIQGRLFCFSIDSECNF